MLLKDVRVMANNELTIKKDDLIPVVEKEGLGNVIKPLIDEIHLFDTFVAGTTHLKDQSVLKRIAVGDKLTLCRENNRYDDNAILVLNEKKEKIGYIPEKDNVVFARLMDAGKMLMAKIVGIDQKGSFTQIKIGIYLVDF